MADIFELFKKIGMESSAAKPITHLVVGLGNPGAEYAMTRHNAGFLALDHLAERYGTVIDRARFQGLTGECTVLGTRVLLLKPQTFMNLSGNAVREAAAFYKIAPENVIVIYDDVNLDVGRLRVRGKGSDGGHNGMKSIIYQLQSDAFPRIRIGVGKKPNPAYDLADWVLSTFSAEDREKIRAAFGTVEKGLEHLLCGDMPAAMQCCNGK